MDFDFEPYEQLGSYPLDEELRQQLYDEQLECMVGWSNRDGWPVAVMHWYVWHEGRFWVTAMHQRKRVAALAQRPQSCVVVSSAGTRLGPARTVTAKTLATIHQRGTPEGDEVADWFYPALAAKAWSRVPEEEAKFLHMLRNTDRVVIELAPVQFITYDALKMQDAIKQGRAATAD